MSIAGLQEPEIPLVEELGRVKFDPVQKGPVGSKVGAVGTELSGITIVVS